VLKIVPEQLMRKYHFFPIKKEGNRLYIAMAEPVNVLAIDDLRLLTGFDIEPVLRSEKEIRTFIERHFGLPEVEKAIQDLGIETEVEDSSEIVEDIVDVAPVIRLVNALLTKAIEEEASDIHIEPYEHAARVRYRTDGMLREVMKFPRTMVHAVVSRIKVMGSMDIAERRVPQDGRVPIKRSGRELDLRISTVPTVYGEKVVIRILDKGSIKSYTMERLGFSQYNLDRFTSFLKCTCGMVLVTGPTGSGKTTTLYTALNSINDVDKNIITVEDPVEYMLDGINQSQVNTKSGATFAKYLRSILRQDPDIILIGEIRDMETAEIAVRAATTGHLVLSSLHTNDAPGAVSRLLDMEIEPFMVASSVLGAVAQRLVRRVCEHCKKERYPEEAEMVFAGIKPDQVLHYGSGCERCNGTGYHGRIAIYEIFTISAAIQNLILNRASTEEIRKVAIREGMVTLKDDGMIKALQGVTTVREIMRVAYREDNL
jgi:type IV pilus assembly protein PilB